MRRRIHLVSLGCPKNRVDAEMMAHLALEEGYELTGDPAEAQVIVVNTCGFIEEARRESVRTILEMAGAKQWGRCRTLVVAGCLAERSAGEIGAELPEVDRVIGLGRLEALRAALAGAEPPRGRADRRVLFPCAGYGRIVDGPGHTAFVKVGDGCSRRCAFCAIPAIRGPGRSRPLGSILREARDLARAGAREIVLVSQDLTAWGRDLEPRRCLRHLVEQLARIEGLAWIRLLYLYPDRTVLDLAGLLAAGPPVLPYVDLPLQHVTDRMLRIMRRGHGRDRIERLLGTLRDRVEGLTVRTTFVVGHPGETARDFDALLAFFEEHRPERIGLLRYSEEEGTAAATMPGKVARAESYRRWRLAASVAARILLRHNRALRGVHAEVMVDGPSSAGPYLIDARLPSQAPGVDGKVVIARAGRPLSPGELVRVRVRRAMGPDLLADLVP